MLIYTILDRDTGPNAMYQVDANGKLFNSEYAILVPLTPGVKGLMLPTIPLDLNTILSVNPIYLNLNN